MESQHNSSEGRPEYSGVITQEFIYNLWLQKAYNITPETADLLNETDKFRKLFNDWIINSTDQSVYPEKYMKNTLIILFYSLIIIVSLFGNLLVCKVIVSRYALRKRTTNILILNLSVSDLMMTVFAIPVTVARLILDDWPLGSTLCSLAPFIQVTSIYVSAITMTVIALDRYQVLINPMKARLCSKIPKYMIIGLIWMGSGVLSIPHSIFNRTVELFAYRPIFRCQLVYPEPVLFYRRMLTVMTTSTQYLFPLSITFFTYGLIALKIYRKATIGEMTEQQLHQRLTTKQKTIKMLMTVVIIFAVCWLPINLYHIINDFMESQTPLSSTTFLLCHWLAFSSVCWNPFIYFGLNVYYREGLRKVFNFSFNTPNNSVVMNTRSSALLSSRSNSKLTERKLSTGIIPGRANDKQQQSRKLSDVTNDHNCDNKKKYYLAKQHLLCYPGDKERTGNQLIDKSTNF